jgi:hypothetical protein
VNRLRIVDHNRTALAERQRVWSSPPPPSPSWPWPRLRRERAARRPKARAGGRRSPGSPPGRRRACPRPTMTGLVPA